MATRRFGLPSSIAQHGTELLVANQHHPQPSDARSSDHGPSGGVYLNDSRSLKMLDDAFNEVDNVLTAHDPANQGATETPGGLCATSTDENKLSNELNENSSASFGDKRLSAASSRLNPSCKPFVPPSTLDPTPRMLDNGLGQGSTASNLAGLDRSLSPEDKANAFGLQFDNTENAMQKNRGTYSRVANSPASCYQAPPCSPGSAVLHSRANNHQVAFRQFDQNWPEVYDNKQKINRGGNYEADRSCSIKPFNLAFLQSKQNELPKGLPLEHSLVKGQPNVSASAHNQNAEPRSHTEYHPNLLPKSIVIHGNVSGTEDLAYLNENRVVPSFHVRVRTPSSSELQSLPDINEAETSNKHISTYQQVAPVQPAEKPGLGAQSPQTTQPSSVRPHAFATQGQGGVGGEDSDVKNGTSNSISQSESVYGPPPQFRLPVRAGNLPASVSDGAIACQSVFNDPFAPIQQPDVKPPVQVEAFAQHAETPAFMIPPSLETKAQRSEMLNRLTGASGVPTLQVIMDPTTFPFVETARQSQPAMYGVVHLKNVPYNSTRAEIIAFLGRNSRILNDNDEPVHIIMDRVTSKTNDAYVEYLTMEDAMNSVSRHESANSKGRVARLGDRPVEVELSSQTQLMKDLFPSARGVIWEGSKPAIQQDNPREPWDNFKTFVTAEEMCMLIKHVEVPQRSPFSRDCPERAFECMISTIKKMPWYMTDYITIGQRHTIFEACCKLLGLLRSAIRDGRHEARMTSQLLKRLTNAAMLCPGFTVLQKDSVACLVNMPEREIRFFNQPRFGDLWRHQYTLGPKAGIPLDVLEYYIAVIREETTRTVDNLPIRERQNITELDPATNGY